LPKVRARENDISTRVDSAELSLARGASARSRQAEIDFGIIADVKALA
jgi:hypothetical protein